MHPLANIMNLRLALSSYNRIDIKDGKADEPVISSYIARQAVARQSSALP
jgi:hypothetical protein